MALERHRLIEPWPPGSTSMPLMRSAQRCRDLLLTVAVNAVSAPPGTFFYGGQAVIEGVLMRGKDRYAVAARRPERTRSPSAPTSCAPACTRQACGGVRFCAASPGCTRPSTWGCARCNGRRIVQLGQDAEIGEGAMRGAMIASLVFALVLFIGVPLLLGGSAAPRLLALDRRRCSSRV